MNHEYLHKSTKEPIAGATPAPAKAKKDTEDEDEDEEQNILSKIKGLTPNTRRLLYKVSVLVHHSFGRCVGRSQ